MKKILLIAIAALFVSAASAEQIVKKETNVQFPYVSLGLGPAPIPLPIFGAGYRAQWGHHGVNAAANVTTLYYVTGVKGSLLYNYYFKPNVASEFYFGVGPAVGVGFEKHYTTEFGFASEFAFGKQYRNETGDLRFFEATIDFPLVINKKHGPKFVAAPLVIFNYGIGF